MTLATSALLRAVASFPGGATTRQLAAVLGVPPRNIGARLSQAWMYGKIDRDVIRPNSVGVSGRHLLWRAKS